MKGAKKALIVLMTALAVCALAFAGCGPKPGDVKVTLDKASAAVQVGGTVQLAATVTGSDAAAAWSTSDAGIASVSDSGLVTGISAGSAVITASVGEAKAECTVTVSASAVSTVSLDRAKARLDLGETLTLTADASGFEGSVVWESGNESVAKVSGGVVTPVAAGTTVIKAKAGAAEAACTVAVVSRTDYYVIETADDFYAIEDNLNGKYVLAADIDFAGGELPCLGATTPIGQKPFQGILDGNGHKISNFTINSQAKADADTGYNVGIFQKIGPRGVVRNLVIEDCVVYGGGSVAVFADANAGLIENVYVSAEVKPKFWWNNAVGGVVSSNFGTIRNAVAVIDYTPAEGTDEHPVEAGAIAARASENAVAENCYAVSANMDIKGSDAKGAWTKCEKKSSADDLKSAALFAGWQEWTSSDGTLPALVQGTSPRHTLAITASEFSVEDGKDEILSVRAFGGEGSEEVEWATENGEIVAVERDPDDTSVCYLTAVSEGAAKVTATVTLGGKVFRAECLVTVTAARATVTVNADSAYADLKPGDTATMTAMVTAKGQPVADAEVVWSSSDEKVATVDAATGVVTAVGPGYAVITASVENCVKEGIGYAVVQGEAYYEDFKGENEAPLTELPDDWKSVLGNWAGTGSLKITADGLTVSSENIWGVTPVVYLPKGIGGPAKNYYVDYVFTGLNVMTNDADRYVGFFYRFGDNASTQYYQFNVKQQAKDSGVTSQRNAWNASPALYQQWSKDKFYENIDRNAAYRVRIAVNGDKVSYYLGREGGLMTLIDTGQNTIDTENYKIADFGFEISSGAVTIRSVSVNFGEQPVEVSLDRAQAEVREGKTLQLAAACNYGDKTLEWTVAAGADVVSVSANGLVTGLKQGSATVRARVMDGDTVLAYRDCEITVTEAVPDIVVEAGGEYVSLAPGGAHTIKAHVEVKGETVERAIKYASDNTAVATVDADTGAVTAVKAGYAEILLTVEENGVAVSESAVTVVVEGKVYGENFKDENGAKLAALPEGWNPLMNVYLGPGTYEITDDGLKVAAEKFGCTPKMFLPTGIAGPAKDYYVDFTFTNLKTMTNDNKRSVAFMYRFSGEVGKADQWKGYGFSVMEHANQTGGLASRRNAWNNAGDFNEWQASADTVSQKLDAQKAYRVRIAVIGNFVQFYFGEEGQPLKRIITGQDTIDTAAYPLSDFGFEIGSGEVTLKNVEVTLGKQPLTLTVDKTDANMKVGETLQLKAAVNDPDLTVQWSSSDESVATVDNNGLVTALKGGSVVIKASAGGREAVCNVEVLAYDLKLKEGSAYVALDAGGTKALEAVLTKDGTEQAGASLTYVSDNEAVATVAADGTVTAAAPGYAHITVSAEPVSGITLTAEAAVVVNGEAYTADFTKYADWAAMEADGWKKSGGTVTPSADGLLFDAVAYWKTENLYLPEGIGGPAKSYYVDYTFTGLTPYANGAAAPDTSRYVGFQYRYGANKATNYYQFALRVAAKTHASGTIFSPHPGKDAYLEPYSEDLDAAAVYTARVAVVGNFVYHYVAKGDGPFVLLNMRSGAATIAADNPIADFGIQVASAKVTLKSVTVRYGKAPVMAAISETAKTVKAGDSFELNVKVNDPEAVIAWSSGDESIASVDNNGLVTALKGGTVTITATVNGTALTCEVTVLAYSLTFAEAGGVYVQETGSARRIEARLTKDGVPVPEPAFTYASSNEAAATVAADGTVTAVAPGEAEITVTAATDIEGVTEQAKTTVIVNKVLYETNFTADTTWDTLAAEGWTKADNKGAITAGADGLLMDSKAYYNTPKVYLPREAFKDIETFYVAYTFTYQAVYNNDARRFLGFKYAFGAGETVTNDKNSCQLAIRQKATDNDGVMFSQRVNGTDANANAAFTENMDPAKTYRVLIAVRGGKAYHYIAVGDGAYQLIAAVSGKDLKADYAEFGAGIEASSSKVLIQSIAVYSGDTPVVPAE